MGRITYTSVLGGDYRQEVESLLFFNPEQHRVRQAILQVIEAYGIPTLVEEAGRLRVRLKSGREVQALFALAETASRSRLAGVMVYTRVDPATILILHLAVTPEYSYQGPHRREALVVQLVAKLREIAARIKGVRVVRFLYGKGRMRDLHV